MASSHSVMSRSSSFGGSTRRTCFRKYLNGHCARVSRREADCGSPLSSRIELGRPRADPSVPDREVVGLPRQLRALPVGEMGVHLEDPRRRGAGRSRRPRRVEARQPPVGFVERGADRRNEARGLGKGAEQRRVVRLRLPGSRSVEVEKERRGELLALLIEAAQIPARVARGQVSGQPSDALLERAGGFPGPLAIQRERERREGLVDLPALRVEEHRVLEVGARMARLVETEKERVRAARESARAVFRDVDASGTGAVGFDREGPDGIREPRRRVRRRQCRRGQDLELFEELLERGEGRGVQRVRHAGELEDELAATARERAKVARVRLGATGAFESAEGEALRGARLGEPPAPPLRPLGELFLPGVVGLAAGHSRLLKLRDRADRAPRGAGAAPQPICASRRARATARVPGASGPAALRPLERQGSGGQAPRAGPRPRIRRRSSRGRRAPPGPDA